MKRLKRVLVESFVGAIAIGWILAQGLMHFANALTTPFSTWIFRQQYRDLPNNPYRSTDFSFRYALPELAKCASLLVLCYILLRWLYFQPPIHESVPDSAPTA